MWGNYGDNKGNVGRIENVGEVLRSVHFSRQLGRLKAEGGKRKKGGYVIIREWF